MIEEVDATIGILETYHQKGGIYVIPVEVINDVEGLLEEQKQEIERLKQDNEYLNKVNIELSSRNIKAIEYIKKNCDITKSYYPYVDTRYIDTKTLLDILKGSDKE